MAKVTGRRLGLSLPRRWITDLMRLSRPMPVASIEKELLLPELAAARSRLAQPPSWLSLFIKSYALVAQELAPLRRSYQSIPWPHLYEADFSLATVAISREFEGELGVFFGLLHAPNEQSLPQLSQHLQDFKSRPINEISNFRRMVRISRYPAFLRRLIWWYGYQSSGRMRAKHFGTFGVSVLGASGVTLLDLVFPVATSFTLGPISPDGRVLARLFFDHRVLDGATAAQAMHLWESCLNGAILTELRGLSSAV